MSDFDLSLIYLFPFFWLFVLYLPTVHIRVPLFYSLSQVLKLSVSHREREVAVCVIRFKTKQTWFKLYNITASPEALMLIGWYVIEPIRREHHDDALSAHIKLFLLTLMETPPTPPIIGHCFNTTNSTTVPCRFPPLLTTDKANDLDRSLWFHFGLRQRLK